MDDVGEQAVASQLPGNSLSKDDTDVQHGSKLNKDEEEDRVTVTVDSVVDAFFDSGGSKEDGSIVSGCCSDALSQDHNDPVTVIVHGDGEEGQTQVPILDIEKDMVMVHTGGGDGSMTGVSNACIQEHDMEQVGKNDGNGSKELECGEMQTVDESCQSPRDFEQEMDIRHQVQEKWQSCVDNDHAVSGSGEGTERANPEFLTHDTSSYREERDGKGDGVINKSDDQEEYEQNENGVMWSDRSNSSMTSDHGAENGRQQDENENTGVASNELNSQDASLLAQGIVDDVLDKLSMVEAGTGENSADRMDLEFKVKTCYPELKMVNLNSDDWDNEFQTRGSTAPDSASLSSSVHDHDSQHHEVDQLLCDSEQIPDPAVDMNAANTTGSPDTKLSGGETELHGDSQSLLQCLTEHSRSSDLPPQSEGKTHTVPGKQAQCSEANKNKPSPENKDRQESVCAASPKPEYPLNYNNYKVCRVLSPGVKECLILETGEQVLCDSSKTCITLDSQQVKSPPDRYSPTQTEKESVKKDLFPDTDRVQRSTETALFPPAAVFMGKVTTSSSTEKLPPFSHCPPQQLRSAQYALGSRNVWERSQEAEDSQDGSYLWLQRQVQWRAGSPSLSANTAVRETRDGYGETSPSSGQGGEGRRTEISGGERESRDSMVACSTSVSLSGSAEASGSMASPGAIPNFRTLQDQQVSWLSMYRMLEDQHRGELQAQYAEHQRTISDMQRHLEGELLNQQLSVQQKLDFHREALTKRSPCAGYRKAQERRSTCGIESSQSDGCDTDGLQQISHCSSLLEPSEGGSKHFADRLTLLQSGYARSAHKKLSQRSLQVTQRSSSGMVHEKQLCGGVYSSPMPIGKVRTSARELSGRGDDSKQVDICSANKTGGSNNSQPQHTAAITDPPLHLDLALSPRARLNLREKHAKHLSDLRVYYEAEIQDLRHKLASLSEGLVLSSSSTATDRQTARERILQEENQSLRRQIRDLQDSLDDAHIHSRELEQKLQGLEIRAANYAERYEESQHKVMKLKNRLEEEHAYARDRECLLEQVQSSERRQAAALQELCKAQEEQTETTMRDKSAMKRLLDKYEMLEKDYSALKETSAEFEKKLSDTRSETVELYKMISQLELENKMLTQENENMRNGLAVSGRNPIGGEVTPPRRVTPNEENTDRDKNSDSPVLRAEQELRRLQKTMDRGDFVPSRQPKKYCTGYSLQSLNSGATVIDAITSPARHLTNTVAASGPQERPKKVKKTVSSVATFEKASDRQSRQVVERRPGVNTSSNLQSSSLSSPTRFDVAVQQMGSGSAASPGGARKEEGSSREVAGKKAGRSSPVCKSPASKGENAASHLVEATLEHICRGDIVSRPQWEDVYTSLAKSQHPDKSPALNMTQEEMLRERIRSIGQMERRYDALQAEKRNLESQLNKVPSHGRDRKSRREKELLEEKLDMVDHQLGSLRMTLKRYQVLKTAM